MKDETKAALVRYPFEIGVRVNPHHSYNQTVEQFIVEREQFRAFNNVAPEVRAKMIETDTVIAVIPIPAPHRSRIIHNIMAYTFHYDFDAALEIVLASAPDKTV